MKKKRNKKKCKQKAPENIGGFFCPDFLVLANDYQYHLENFLNFFARPGYFTIIVTATFNMVFTFSSVSP